MNTNITLNEKILEVLEDNGISVNEITEQDGEYIAELEFWSPAGEDMAIDIWYNGLASNFVEKFTEYAYDFDADEHAREWIENGSRIGVRELIDDADAIYDFLDDVSRELNAIEFTENENSDDADAEFVRAYWEEVLKSNMGYGEIAHAIGWGFSNKDLQELMRLHEADICREKIEDLLTDCNFHTECDDWHEGNYVIREF